MMSSFYDLARSVDLRTPFFSVLPFVLLGLLVLGVFWWAFKRLRLRTALIITGTVAVLMLAAALYTNLVWKPVADGIATPVWLWAGGVLVLSALALACLVASWKATPRLGRLRQLTATLVVLALSVLTAANGINSFYGAYPNLAAAMGLSIPTSNFQELGLSSDGKTFDPQGKPISATWSAPADMPQIGQVVVQKIPSNDAAFTPRDAYIYLPPAYFTEQRPLLPVVVLMAGQPGSPGDWFNMGGLDSIMNSYAAQHQGLAPVVVVVDQLGGDWTNPLCSDTSHGKVATYLQETVPTWLEENLQVSTDHSQWAIGGLSNGGTCALQVVTRAPEVYPTFFDLSGEGHPSLGGEDRTITKGFDGDRAAYEANDPLTTLGKTSYRGKNVAGIFAIGAKDDAKYTANLKTLYTAAQSAGMEVQWKEYDGKHEWKVWSAAFADTLPWFATRSGLTG